MRPRSRPLITLTTDFGMGDPYAAAMKGIIYGIAPDVEIADLSHDIPPHDILEGALFLAGALPYFPAGTIHAVVVDPGVGMARHPIALWAGNQTIVCPDNGLPTLFTREHPIEEVRLISNSRFMCETVSPTFHGRDVFAPAAARLASGAPFHELGEELDTIVTLDIPHPQQTTQGGVEGEVIHVDRFGNLVTNIHRSLVSGAFGGTVSAGDRCRLSGIHRTYGEVPPGEPLALFGSCGYLEIAMNAGNAAVALGLDKGAPVELKP